jgi:cystathionine beta-lyase/cystathionine gamma-synthase
MRTITRHNLFIILDHLLYQIETTMFPGRPSLGDTTPVAMPLYQSAVYAIPDLDTLDSIIDQGDPGFVYARDAHPNGLALANALQEMHQSAWSCTTGSGMGAISCGIMSCVKSGHQILASKHLYGRTTQLLKSELIRYGVQTNFIDFQDLEAVAIALKTKPKLLIIETISNPLLHVPKMQVFIAMAQSVGCRVLVDNTFATPELCKPLKLGADLVMESLTKMISGHSDVTLGVLFGNDPSLGKQAKTICSVYGFSGNPFECWLTLRSLPTFEIRQQRAMENAHRLAEWFCFQPKVQRVIYPGLKDHPDHETSKELFGVFFGTMLTIELKPATRQAVDQFIRAKDAVAFAPSLGDVHTTVSYPDLTSHRYESVESKQDQGITQGLVRISTGIESLEIIKAKFTQMLAAID